MARYTCARFSGSRFPHTPSNNRKGTPVIKRLLGLSFAVPKAHLSHRNGGGRVLGGQGRLGGPGEGLRGGQSFYAFDLSLYHHYSLDLYFFIKVLLIFIIAYVLFYWIVLLLYYHFIMVLYGHVSLLNITDHVMHTTKQVRTIDFDRLALRLLLRLHSASLSTCFECELGAMGLWVCFASASHSQGRGGRRRRRLRRRVLRQLSSHGGR